MPYREGESEAGGRERSEVVVGPGLGKRAAREALLCENLLGSESDLSGFFSFLYLKKLKFQKYMAVSKNFKIIPLSPLAWATGGMSPSGWATGSKCKKNYI